MDARPTTLTKFEHAKAIGVRTEMLARGAPPMVVVTDKMARNGVVSPQLIAEAEYAHGVLPFDVVRRTTDNRHVVVKAWRGPEK